MDKPVRKFQKRKFRLERKEKQEDDKNILLIICEGETEEVYFKDIRAKLRDSRLNIIPIDVKGTDTNSLFNEAKKYMIEKNVKISNGDQVWIIFDRDSNTDHQINMIVEKSKAKSFELGFSNPSFELWFLLHFEYITHRIDNDDLLKRLEKFIEGYEKPKSYINTLFPLNNDAIKRGNDLIRYHEKDKKNLFHDKSNPISHVVKLLSYILES